MDCGFKKVEEIVDKFATRDPFEIARRAGIAVIYESWYPVTLGEFEKKTRKIRVNLQAIEKNTSFAEIVAHELGHFFAIELDLNKKNEEIFARAFAENLLQNKSRLTVLETRLIEEQ